MCCYLDVIVSFFTKYRCYVLPLAALSLCFTAGCFAVTSAGEVGEISGAGEFSWKTIATVWGPLGFMVVWFMLRDKEDRKERNAERDEEKEERREMAELVKNNTVAMTKLEGALMQSHANDEKNRLAIYKWADTTKEVCIKIDAICSVQSGGTRIMAKE